MAFETAGSVPFPYMLQKAHAQDYDILGATKKAMLMAQPPVGNEEFIDEGVAQDIRSKELNTANYVRGWGGSGRQPLTGSFNVNANVNDLTALSLDYVYSTSHIWNNLGTTGDSVAGILIVIEGTSDDTDSHPLLWLPFSSSQPLEGESEQWSPSGVICSILINPPVASGGIGDPI